MPFAEMHALADGAASSRPDMFQEDSAASALGTWPEPPNAACPWEGYEDLLTEGDPLDIYTGTHLSRSALLSHR